MLDSGRNLLQPFWEEWCTALIDGGNRVSPVEGPVLGVSGLFHDAAAALVIDGEVVAAAEQERFSRLKNDPSLPVDAIKWVLDFAEVGSNELGAISFYEKPLSAFARFLSTMTHVAPRGLGQFRRGVPSWLKDKLWVGLHLERLLFDLGQTAALPVRYGEHHRSHAASAFFPSPFDSAAIVTADGVGEWTTTTIGRGGPEGIDIVEQIEFPHSLGLLYSMFTQLCGFEVNEGEYKLMGLAPYGRPTYRDRILEQVVDLRPDGSFHLNERYLGYISGPRMTNRPLESLFGPAVRSTSAPISRRQADLAASIQSVVETAMLGLARRALDVTGERRLCIAGGVGLNAVANGRIRREVPFDDLWVQPAAGDAGGAIGAALELWHEGRVRKPPRGVDGMAGTYLGPCFDDFEIAASIAAAGLIGEVLDPSARPARLAGLLASGAIIGHFDGRMEFGPRALGNRSILADPRDARVQMAVNLRVKHRETFRPFAPIVLAERAHEWFDLPAGSDLAYMTEVVQLRRNRLVESQAAHWPPEVAATTVRSHIPAVSHVDGSARVQVLQRDRNPRLHAVLCEFERRTECPVLLNTSLNVRGEPIACTPDDAIRLMGRAGLDAIVLGDHLVRQR